MYSLEKVRSMTDEEIENAIWNIEMTDHWSRDDYENMDILKDEKRRRQKEKVSENG